MLPDNHRRMNQPLILASGSPRRRELLERAGFDLRVIVPDESVESGVRRDQSPARFVAAAAFIASLPAHTFKSPEFPTPIMIMNATEDALLPYDGGAVSGFGAPVRSVPETVPVSTQFPFASNRKANIQDRRGRPRVTDHSRRSR